MGTGIKIIEATESSKEKGFYAGETYLLDVWRQGIRVTNERLEIIDLENLVMTGATIKAVKMEKEHEHYIEMSGRDNQGRWGVEIAKSADYFTDHKTQIRINTSNGDNSDYINFSREELIKLRDIISRVIE